MLSLLCKVEANCSEKLKIFSDIHKPKIVAKLPIMILIALMVLYRDYESSFEELLESDNTKAAYTKNLQKLMIEVYKSFNHLNPEYIRGNSS